MKLPIAIATLFLAAITALPASARVPTGHSFYVRDAARAESVQHGYRHAGYRHAYAAAPLIRQPLANGRGHCIAAEPGETLSAYPNWEVC